MIAKLMDEAQMRMNSIADDVNDLSAIVDEMDAGGAMKPGQQWQGEPLFAKPLGPGKCVRCDQPRHGHDGYCLACRTELVRLARERGKAALR